MLGLAALAGWLVAAAVTRPRRALDARVAHGFLVQLPLIVGGALLDLLPLAAFAAAAYGLLPLFDPSAPVRLVALALINASVLARGVAVVARIVLAPSSEARRLLPIASETAAYVFVWIRRFTAVTVYGYFGLETAKLLGLPPSLYGLFRNLAGLLFAALLVVFVLQVGAASPTGCAARMQRRARRACACCARGWPISGMCSRSGTSSSAFWCGHYASTVARPSSCAARS